MDEDEAALLAELRAISDRSSAATRFQTDDNGNDRYESGNTNASTSLNASTQNPSSPSPQNTTNDMSFVSAKSSSSTERFHDAVASPAATDTNEKNQSPARLSIDVPWKGVGDTNNSDNDTVANVSVDVSTPPPALSPPAPPDEKERSDQTAAVAHQPKQQQQQSFQVIKSTMTSTFQGDRGGAAQDEELLAELRAISARSSSANRFADNEHTTATTDDGDEAEKPIRTLDTAMAPDPHVESSLPKRASSSRPSPKTKQNSGEVPPWKRGKNKPVDSSSSFSSNVDIVVAAPPAPPTQPAEETTANSDNEPEQSLGDGMNSTLPSTFQGERGGAAHDEDLLAELRAISARSSTTDRFAQSDSEATDKMNSTASPEPAPENLEPASSSNQATHPYETISRPSPRPKHSSNAIPPWKRGNKTTAQSGAASVDVDIVVAAPPAPAGGQDTAPSPSEPAQDEKLGIQSSLLSKRGGAAEDAELLAELRAISAKSSSSDRFSHDETGLETNAADSTPREHDNEKMVAASTSQTDRATTASRPPSTRPRHESVGAIPPWKRGKKKAVPSSSVEVDVVVSAPSATKSQSQSAVQPDVAADDAAQQQKFGIKDSQSSTFKGDRGGAAEDAELLAELRAISMKSSSSDRFAGDSNADGAGVGASDPVDNSVAASIKKVIMKGSSQRSLKGAEPDAADLPPWKRGNKKSSNMESAAVTGDTVVAAASPANTRETMPDSFGFKSSMPSTFKGDRGGPAEEEELLAELRAISMKSSSTDRFADESTDNGGHASASIGAGVSLRSRAPLKPKPDASQPMSWKRGKSDAFEPSVVDVDVLEAQPSNPVPIKSTLPSTFQGDRGGPAEDADLLAELRAISGGSSRAERLSDEPNRGPASNEVTGQSVEEKVSASLPSDAKRNTPSSVAPPNSAADEAPPVVTTEMLPSAVADKSWKMRKAAYIFLRDLLAERLKQGEQSGSIQGDTLMPGLDDAIPTIVADSHVGALDTALMFALDYAEHCGGASSSDLAAKISTSLLKGNALSSRPSTVKCASALTLKLMEVCSNGHASVHAVSEVLLAQGLSSRKPKIVIGSSALILEAAYSFGAGTLPLAAISSSAPKMLSHSNATVRETGLKIVAEICRALGSKTPLQSLIDGMKKAQLSQLDSLLESQPEPTPVRVGLRSSQGSSSSQSPADALASLEAGAKEMEAKRFAERDPFNLLQALPKTDYSTRIRLSKWSEKVAALDIALECGGETPYKLVQPSSSVNYSPMISEMKALLSHSHFAVCSKSMKVLSMLAEGVGPGLFPHLRPLLGQLIMLSKDKKLNRAAGECLDVFFGNVLEIDHLLDKDDALPSVLNEKAQKNALVRATALAFLERCIKRGETAGPRGRIRSKSVLDAARLCCEKLEDSDASVRKAATDALRSLLTVDYDAISPIIDSLQTTNSRAYKSLKGSGAAVPLKRGSACVMGKPKNSARGGSEGPPSGQSQHAPPNGVEKASSTRRIEKSAKTAMAERSRSNQKAGIASQSIEDDMSESPSLEDAMSMIASAHIPSWDGSEDDGGVFAGLKSPKWLQRQNAISSLTAFCKTEDSPVVSNAGLSSAILVVVKEHTRGFKETNVNVTKGIVELFTALAQAHATQVSPFPGWARRDAVRLAVDKIADRKLSALSSSMLSDLCCVCPPFSVLETGFVCVEKIKSPLGHEAFLKWFNALLTEFGAASIANVLKNAVDWLVKECECTNLKVRKMALAVAGELHLQLGPSFRALVLSACADGSSAKSQLETVFEESPFNPAALTMERPRECVVLRASNGPPPNGVVTATSVMLDLPKLDLSAALPNDCIEKMGSKEGKNAWKLRKQALDDVEVAITKSTCLISTDSLKPLVELLRALRERLSDSQSNLKPISARIIGSVLGSVDTQSQSKLGRIVYAPLISAVMSDNRKPMREASMEAIRVGTTASSLEAGEPSTASLESFMVAIVGELNESDFKAGGLPDVFQFITGVAQFLPDLDSVVSSSAQSLGDKFAAVMVGALTSSKSETRSAAEGLLKACIENGKLSLKCVKKGMKHLLPAQQRSVIPIVARLPHPQKGSPNGGKENSVPMEPPMEGRQPKPRGLSSSGGSTIPSPRPRRRPESSRGAEERARVPSAQLNESFERESIEPDDAHPLIATGEPGKKPLSFSRRINWPEHPEEPSSPGQLNALKKVWSRSLPSRSVAALFPTGGIRKQEDAMKGCALLRKAIEKDRTGHEEAIVDHVDVIFMWTSFALCSRESTVGLQPLITLLVELLSFLKDNTYKLSDGEAIILLPHIFEKASTAKGRFREQFHNVISFFRLDLLISARTLGQVICVPLIERSHQSKTRVLALHECRSCVDRIGLGGLGKKGLLVTARALSEESLPENRAAALDLMEVVLSKMDGDVEKLASICGTTYLSDSGKEMIEQRWKKHAGSHHPTSNQHTQRNDRSRRRSELPSSRISADTARRTAPMFQTSRPSPSPERPKIDMASAEVIRDELPSFRLALDDNRRGAISSYEYTEHSHSLAEGPFTFSFDAKQNPHDGDQIDTYDEFLSRSTTSSMVHRASLAAEGPSTTLQLNDAPAPKSEGAAASLRARLLKIREKQKEEYASSPLIQATSSPTSPSSPLADAPGVLKAKTAGTEKKEVEAASENSYDVLHSRIEELLHTETPVPEAHPNISECTSALKKYHAVVSNQPEAAPDLTHSEFSNLRQSISDRTVDTVENLTSVVVFAFSCEYPEHNAGMSIPLLSVALATLMALFRDPGLSQNVTQDSLALLIRETGKALLDPRLAVSSHHAMTSQLDESTSSQMVRAINKLAVQAATGSPRNVSIEALLALQLQLCTVGNDTAADAAFNSRLSRIVTKLFAKVLKAEGASATPFSSGSIDLEAIICALDDMLVGTDRQDAVENCSNMGRSLLIPILNARGEGSVEVIRSTMEELGVDSQESKLALLLTACEAELDFPANTTVQEHEKLSSSGPDSPDMPPSMNVASLVSELGSAPEGPEREAGIAALRRYNERHGEEELHAHLSEVSEAFRAFIMEQLNESSASMPESPSATSSRAENKNGKSASVSERIRFLRSKLNATEAAVQSAMQPSSLTVATKPVLPPDEETRTTSAPSTPSRKVVSEARLTPSRIPKMSSSVSATGGAALSLRERLAAAQKKRADAAKESETNDAVGGGSSSTTSAYGHAASLRARLEAVKQQSNHG